MDEAFLVMFVCGLPLVLLFGLVGLIVWLVRGQPSSSRIADLELQIHHLRTAHEAIGRRLHHLERPSAQGPGAAATVAVGVSDPEPAPAVAGPAPASAAAAPPPAPPTVEPEAPAPEARPQPIPTPPSAGGPGAPPTGERDGWERWIGVRGAAALGAGVLVLAGLYFFKYSIDHGLITPAMRVVLGTLTGLGCLLVSERPLRRHHPLLANWVAGAGSALLYLSFWSASALFGLIGVELAFPLMALVTAACCVLAVHRRAASIAVLGLLGGFATPILLSTGSDRPIALFGYILLLDAALLFVAHRRRWPALALLSLGGTALYQGLWILGHMDDRLWLGIAILLVFASLFALAELRRGDEKRSPLWPTARLFGVLTPFLFALYFALRADLGPHLYPIAILLGILSAGAAWVGRREKVAVLPLGAAAASMAVLSAWLLRHPLSTGGAWELVACVAGLALLFHLFLEVERRRTPEAGMAAGLTTLGPLFLTLVAAAANAEVSPWAWITGWTILTALTVRHAVAADRGPLLPVVASLVGLALATLHLARGGDAGALSEGVFLGVAVAAVVAFSLLGVFLRSARGRVAADHAAAAMALLLLLHHLLLPAPYPLPPVLFFTSVGLLALLMLLAATRRSSGAWTFGAVAATALVCAGWTLSEPGLSAGTGVVGLVGQGALVLLFTAWPFFASPRLRDDPWAWRAAALAAPLFFLQLRHLHLAQLGSGAIGLLPVLLATLTLGAAHTARSRGPRERAARRSALVWLTAVAMGFATVAVPLQLENEWLTIAWALEGLAVLGLWTRLDHPGLKYFGLALLATVSIRLALNPWVLDYHGGMSGVSWLSYTYLVPAACMVGAWALLRGIEPARRRSWEKAVLPGSIDLFAMAVATAAIAVVFVWINLTIFDVFAGGERLSIPIERLPARDLTTSISWAVYGLVLLALGMWRQSTGLRALSLGLVLLTCGKVFLYDLAHLTDLFRVASLAGLALSLMLISFAYQRFVFRKLIPTEGT